MSEHVSLVCQPSLKFWTICILVRCFFPLSLRLFLSAPISKIWIRYSAMMRIHCTVKYVCMFIWLSCLLGIALRDNVLKRTNNQSVLLHASLE